MFWLTWKTKQWSWQILDWQGLMGSLPGHKPMKWWHCGIDLLKSCWVVKTRMEVWTYGPLVALWWRCTNGIQFSWVTQKLTSYIKYFNVLVLLRKKHGQELPNCLSLGQTSLNGMETNWERNCLLWKIRHLTYYSACLKWIPIGESLQKKRSIIPNSDEFL